MRRGASLLAALLLAAQAGAAPPAPPLTARAELGRKLFFDPRLSASGRLSCAGCHDPAHAYAPANRRAVQLGGPRLTSPGTRAVPSLRYKFYTRAYSDLYDNPDRVSPPAPGGGLTWDGRADTMAQQAEIPLLAANEMANRDRATLAAKLNRLYAQPLRAAFGEAALADPVAWAGKALQAFQREDRSFRPFSSRFDKYRNNKLGGSLNLQEQRGLLLYLSADKGNCNACHLLGAANNGSQDITSDYSYAAIGVPRNPQIPANADPAYFDLGLCGPLRQDHAPAAPGAADPYCGQFKAPVLRNVAARGVFMHNGFFKSLREVLRFYATRDTQPELWYPKDALGQVRKFDDLPEAYRGNVDRQAPLDLRPAGSRPALSEAEIDDLLAFLKTLDDDDVAEIPPALPDRSGVQQQRLAPRR